MSERSLGGEPVWQKFFAGWGAEIESKLDRVNDLIGNIHRPSEGSYREILLRDFLRRVLPDRYRVSTGFVLGWPGGPSSQMDVIVWDAHRHAPFMETGEFAVVPDSAVRALIEVKTTLDATNLKKALRNLHPDHYWSFPYRAEDPTAVFTRTESGPVVRGILAYNSVWENPARNVFSNLSGFLRKSLGPDPDAWRDRFPSTIDVIGVGDSTVIENGTLYTLVDGAPKNGVAGYCARRFSGSSRQAWFARFCLVLAYRIFAAAKGGFVPENETLMQLLGDFSEPSTLVLKQIERTKQYSWGSSSVTQLVSGKHIVGSGGRPFL